MRSLAHSMRLADGILPKGRVLDKDDIAQLAVAGISSVVAARLEDGDLNENEAALKIAKALQKIIWWRPEAIQGAQISVPKPLASR